MVEREKRYYETGIVILTGLLLSLTVLDRLAIAYLFPFIINEFAISYAQAASLTSIVSILMAFGNSFFGVLSDRVGRKKVLISATIFLSLIAMGSGLTQSFLQMLVVRGLMGIIMGAVLPACVATIAVESTPSRRGFNFGLQRSMIPLVAYGSGPFLVAHLTQIISWRGVFFVVGLPGLIIAIILMSYMREPKSKLFQQEDKVTEISIKESGFFTVIKSRNIIISSIVAMLILGCLNVFIDFSILYLTKEIHLTVQDAGTIISFFGFSGIFGTILLPLLSDKVGRKKVVIPAIFTLGLSFWGFRLFGSNFILSSVFISIAGFTRGGVLPIVLSALTTESVPPHLAATAAGVPTAIGEIIGGALIPFFTGYLCDLYGLGIAMFFTTVTPLTAGFVAFFYKETAPRIVRERI